MEQPDRFTDSPERIFRGREGTGLPLNLTSIFCARGAKGNQGPRREKARGLSSLGVVAADELSSRARSRPTTLWRCPLALCRLRATTVVFPRNPPASPPPANRTAVRETGSPSDARPRQNSPTESLELTDPWRDGWAFRSLLRLRANRPGGAVSHLLCPLQLRCRQSYR